MSPIVFCIQDNDFLPEAAAALKNHGISGAPVINSSGEYVGVLSQSDINAKLAEQVAGTLAQDLVEDGFPPDLESVRVRDVMTPHLLKISHEASLEELGKSLLIGDVHRMLVVENQEIVGLVSTTDLIHGFLSDGKKAESPKHPVRKPYLFETELNLDQNQVLVSGSFGEALRLEAPPEFGGTGSCPSPEDLFVASITAPWIRPGAFSNSLNCSVW